MACCLKAGAIIRRSVFRDYKLQQGVRRMGTEARTKPWRTNHEKVLKAAVKTNRVKCQGLKG
jgi:hypothetical protein